ncbi:FxSxx-COOH system tetratricopeptide repeat protein [Glycomyces xiaoerkulensis]|uniref:FxSxx-COOH system tetratricopeptide repeat protein n=1 Tax=Glycomyces xiaoerkulensis TaxID=2038139 RepID=UPI0018E4899C|nr:FxSxx-COOH system tetratricopeptide repeat protein [Glycomyces xiaoerkulensis]
MIEPFSAATLSGLAFDTAKTAIGKWVGTRIAESLDTTLRNRQLKQGLPAKDQQTELTAVIRAAVDLTAAELFPDQQRLQRLFCKELLANEPTNWPLVGGSDLTDLVTDVHAWISENDPHPGSHQDADGPAAHQYLSVLCRNIILQFGFRAENNGTKNTILYPRWNRFWITELFTSIEATAAPPAAATEFRNDFSAPIGTVIQTQQVTLGSRPEPPTTWPRRIGALPPIAAAHQARQVDLELADALTEDGTAVVCQILAGMGGVGKTQIAATFAHRQWGKRAVDLLVWINASARESIIAAFAQASSELCGTDGADSDVAAQRFLARLDGADAPRWLIVLDDLTDPADLGGLWPPNSEYGRTIVTTRRRDAALETRARKRIDVDLFTPDQALTYLTERFCGDTNRLNGAADLAHDLGYLPLALAQAAVYILDQPGMTCATYRDRLTDRTLTLDQLSPDTLPDEYPHTISAALQIAIERADRYEPVGLASRLLALASLLDPAGIPADLFTTIQHTVQPDVDPIQHQSGGYSGPPPLPPRAVTDTLARLHRLNLIDHDGTTIRIHALVQRAVCEEFNSDHDRPLVHAIADALISIWPDPENDPAISAMLRSNTMRLRHLADPILLDSKAHAVVFQAGMSLGRAGQVHQAVQYFDQLHTSCELRLGSEHRHTLTAQAQAARWHGEAGNAAEALGAFERLHRKQVQVLGPEDLEILTTRANLAEWTGASGRPIQAAAALEVLGDDSARVLGPEHPNTLRTRCNLARWRGHAGDPARAVEDLELLVEDQHRILGPDHPDTLRTRSNLASWRGETGDNAGAATAFEDLLIDRLRVLGSDHPHTLRSRSNLARWQGAAGNASRAVQMFEALLEDCRHLLGSDHPDTLMARGNLARWRAEAGDVGGAVAEFEDLLADRLRVLGPDHPHTLRSRDNLARWQGHAGNPTRSAAGFEELLDDCTRVLGPNHPATLNARANLARWRGEAGDPATAASAFEEVLALHLNVLGPDHPATLSALGNLARWRGEAGDLVRSVALLTNVVQEHRRVLGRFHPQTLAARRMLADFRGQTGHTVEATSELNNLLCDCLELLGPDHPDTLSTRASLARWRGEAGAPREAADALQALLIDQLRILGPGHPFSRAVRADLDFWRGVADSEDAIDP